MIQLTVRNYRDNPTPITLPTSDSRLAKLLAVPEDQQLKPAIRIIDSVTDPPQLSYLTGQFMNMDEMNRRSHG